jgi:hypothetical protein
LAAERIDNESGDFDLPADQIASADNLLYKQLSASAVWVACVGP